MRFQNFQRLETLMNSIQICFARKKKWIKGEEWNRVPIGILIAIVAIIISWYNALKKYHSKSNTINASREFYDRIVCFEDAFDGSSDRSDF